MGRALAALLIVLGIAGCGAKQWPVASSPVSAPSTAVTTTTEPHTTTPHATTPHTTEITPTSGLPGYTESDAEAGNQGLFDDARAGLERTFRAQSDPKLTALSYRQSTNAVTIAFVYRNPAGLARSRYDDFAWHTSQTLSDSFWFPELVQTFPSHHADPAWLPRLDIRLDNVVYSCPALIQIAVAAHRITESQWLQACAA